MKKYVIAESVVSNSDKPILQKIGKKVFNLSKDLLFSSTIRTVYNLAKSVNDVAVINTSQILKSFTNYKGESWIHDIVYVEHPRMPKVLIPESEFKNLLLREVISDISNYILDNLSVAELTFGVVSSSGGGIGASFPVNQVNANAKINCQIAKSYYHHVTDTVRTNHKRNYIWIDVFPEIKSAVEHGAGSMENIIKSSFNFSAELGIADMIKGSLGMNKNMEFYISYMKK